MNRKNVHFKEWLKTDNEINTLIGYLRKQNWIPLEVPYKSGYWISFDLRDDIKNRADAWVFEKCLELVNISDFCKDKNMIVKIGKGKIHHVIPTMNGISEEMYESLHPAVQKYFSDAQPWNNLYWSPFRKRYYCSAPSHFFVYKVEPRWITHYKEIDSVIEKEISEKRDYLSMNSKFRGVGKWKFGGGAPKSYTKLYNRSDRSYNKSVLRRNLASEDVDKYEYKYAHRHSASWDYW